MELFTFKDFATLNESSDQGQALITRIRELQKNKNDFAVRAGKNRRLAQRNLNYNSVRQRSNFKNRQYRFKTNPLRQIKQDLRDASRETFSMT